jgi:hypothetical protein
MYNQEKVFKLAATRDVVGMSVAGLPGCTCSDLGSSFEAREKFDPADKPLPQISEGF